MILPRQIFLRLTNTGRRAAADEVWPGWEYPRFRLKRVTALRLGIALDSNRDKVNEPHQPR